MKKVTTSLYLWNNLAHVSLLSILFVRFEDPMEVAGLPLFLLMSAAALVRL
jgi:hypothetical protein